MFRADAEPPHAAARRLTMRVLFFMRNFSGYFRQFEPALRELLERGHEVHVARDRSDEMRGEQWAASLQAEHPAFTWGQAPAPQSDNWSNFKRQIRLTSDYLDFLRPEYDQSSELVRRAVRRAPDRVVEALGDPASRWRRPATLRRVAGAIRLVDDASPSPSTIRSFIRERRPDLVLLTPHLMPGSPQQETLRAAREVGVRTGLCVASWDNLSSKQLIRVVPDVVTVWNEVQKREALEIHGLPEDRVAITGAQVYDPWFDWPPRDRAAFCSRVGLHAERPYILYVGGALFPADLTEAEFLIERWLPALRASGRPELRDVAVLVRPHPKRFKEWSAVSFEGLGEVALWPQEGRMPVDEEARADFFDSIHHSAAVFGINTSAMIEAGIVGKRVHTLLVPEFEGSQHGTLHFRFLTDGGLLTESREMDELLSRLAESVAAGGDAPDGNRPFVEAFVRPRGIDRPAAVVFADTLEAVVGRGPVAPVPRTARQRGVRIALEPVGLGFRVAARHRARAKAAGPSPARRAAQKARCTLARRTGVAAPVPAPKSAAKAKPAAAREAAPAQDLLRAAERHVDKVAGAGVPVIVGPWLGEVGFELLYWIPFLNWALERRPELAERLHVVSRGGAGPWYEHLTTGYVDVFELMEPDEVAARRGHRQKQPEVTDLELDLAGRAARHLGLERHALLHPSAMYNAMLGLVRLDAYPALNAISRHRRLAPPMRPELTGVLPDEYVAVKFYFSNSFPDSPANRDVAGEVVRRLAAQSPVVLLNTGLRVDDHEDFHADIPGRVVQIDRHMHPATNLAVQSAVIAGARAYAGTYGGLSYLPPLYGVPSVSFYSDSSMFIPRHLEVAQGAYVQLGSSAYITLHTSQLDVLDLLASGQSVGA